MLRCQCKVHDFTKTCLEKLKYLGEITEKQIQGNFIYSKVWFELSVCLNTLLLKTDCSLIYSSGKLLININFYQCSENAYIVQLCNIGAFVHAEPRDILQVMGKKSIYLSEK